jgi:cathepsin F
MLKVLLFVLCLAIAHSQSESGSEFDAFLFKKYQKFMTKYGKSYPTLEEMNSKFEIFKKNYLKAKLHEEEFKKAEEETKTFGTTEFMDMDGEEFEKTHLNLNQTEMPNDTEIYFNSTQTNETGRFLQEEEIPENWDWTEKNALNPVRNQGYCGGCWAFSAISNIESAYFIKYGKLPSFSEQQLVDCDPYNSGCAGGIMHRTFYYIKYWGLHDSSVYPYEFRRGTCRYNSTIASLAIRGYTTPGTDDEEKIKEMLYKMGPLSITINARLLQYYRGGVLDVPYSMCPYAPNQGVNIVGYGVTRTGIKYWKVRNTWGPRWGEKGYFRIARGKGLCGLNQYVISALIR